ncbi:hypothetical protein VZO05_01065 [Aggregatilineales bacterium SYSU G02658]
MIDVTRPGKHVLTLRSPVMLAAGVAGFGNHYHDLLKLNKFGALVTNPVTLHEWSPTRGTRVVPLESGVLVHTGFPNGGAAAVIKEFRTIWQNAPLPIVLHVIATKPDHMRALGEMIDAEDGLSAVELGLRDDISAETASDFVSALERSTDKPVLVRLPLFDAYEIAQACADSGAGALVVAGPPRGTARDPHSGRLVSGRVYSPLIHPMALRMVGVLRRRVDLEVPIIGAGGIHSLQQARDFIDAGAAAVQVDSLTWIQPSMAERIARDLSGNLTTRMIDALPDEWHPDMGDTEFRTLFSDDEPAQGMR